MQSLGSDADSDEQNLPAQPVLQENSAQNRDVKGQWEQINLEQNRKTPVVINTTMIATASRAETESHDFERIVPELHAMHRQSREQQANRAKIDAFMKQTTRASNSCILGTTCQMRCCSLFNGGCAWIGWYLGENIGRVFFAILWDEDAVQVDNVSLGLTGFIFTMMGVRGLFTAQHHLIIANLCFIVVLSLIFFLRTLVWCFQGHFGTWVLVAALHNFLSFWAAMVFWKLYRWAEYFQHGGVYDADMSSPP